MTKHIIGYQPKGEHFAVKILKEDRIICFEVLDGANIDVKEVDEMHAVSMSVFPDSRYGSLLMATNHFHVSPEARKHGQKPEFHLQLEAQAIVVKSLPQRIIGNFITRLLKDPNKYRIFNSEESAIQWLREKLSN